MGEEKGREGDWECIGCKNRNYAFRSFCNRCKQPRLFFASNTPSDSKWLPRIGDWIDSKWLPRIGDWICTGCTNNNYASREKCKKCGQPKEVAAMPALAVHGANYSHYLSRIQGGSDQKINVGPMGNGSRPLAPGWTTPPWSIVGAPSPGLPFLNPISQLLTVPQGWRSGDWICGCGFHNYSSRAQCKKCNSFPPALGTKRLASDEFVRDWDNKRLNIGHENTQQSIATLKHQGSTIGDHKSGVYDSYSGLSPSLQFQVPMLSLQQTNKLSLVGKGGKQWRDGDWMCTNCNNHNYASRSQCNRCKTERAAIGQSVNAM